MTSTSLMAVLVAFLRLHEQRDLPAPHATTTALHYQALTLVVTLAADAFSIGCHKMRSPCLSIRCLLDRRWNCQRG